MKFSCGFLLWAFVLAVQLLTTRSNGYSCNGQVVDMLVTVDSSDEEGKVTINNCTFLNAVVINIAPSPTTVTVSGTTAFVRGLTMMATTSVDSSSISLTISLEHVFSPNYPVTFKGLRMNHPTGSPTSPSPPSRIVIKDSAFHSLIVESCTLTDGASLVADALLVSEGGAHFINVDVTGGSSKIVFTNSALVSTYEEPGPLPADMNVPAFALLLRDCVFSSDAQLLLLKSNLTSVFETIFLDVRRANISSTTSERGGTHYREHKNILHVFRSGAVFNITDSSVTTRSNSAKSIYSYSYRVETGNKFRQEYFRIAQFADDSTQFVAVNTHFSNGVELHLQNHAVATLDAVSYNNIDLLVHGDSERTVEVPIPSAVSVTSLALYGANVTLPELRNSQRRSHWDVRVGRALIVSGVHLQRNETMTISQREGHGDDPLGVVHISQSSFMEGSRVELLDAAMTHGSFTECSFSQRSSLLISNVTVMLDFTVSSATFSDHSSLFLDNVTTTRNVLLQAVSFEGSSSMMLYQLITSHLKWANSFADNTTSHLEIVGAVVVERGLQLVNLDIDGATLRLSRSKIASTETAHDDPNRFALILRDCSFRNAAQFLISDSRIQSRWEAVLLDAQSNRTEYGLSKTYHFITYVVRLFSQQSVFKVTNSVIEGRETAHAIRSQTKYTQSGNTFHKTFTHDASFAEGSSFVLQQSRVIGSVELLLRDGATAMIDAASFSDLDLSIEGDNVDSIEIPIPHTVNIKRLALTNCRIRLPDLHLAPTINTWDVTVSNEFKVGYLRLHNDQHLHLHSLLQTPLHDRLPRVSISLGAIDVKGQSSISITDTPASTIHLSGSVHENSRLHLSNSSVFGATSLSDLNIAHSSLFMVSNNTSLSSLDVQSTTVTIHSTLSLADTTITEFVRFGDGTVFKEESNLLIHRCLLQASSVSIAALHLAGVLFTASQMCLQDTGIIGKQGGLAMNLLRGPYNGHSFHNNSQLIMSNSVFGIDKGSQELIVSNNVDVRQRWGTITETLIIMRNTTIQNGRARFYLHANKTRVIMDSSTLSQSDLIFLGGANDDGSTSGDSQDWLSGVQYILPAKFSTRLLQLSGGTTRFSNNISTLSAADSDDTEENAGDADLVEIGVKQQLYFLQPLNFTVSNHRQVHIKAVEQIPVVNHAVQVEASLISNKSALIFRDFAMARFIRVSKTDVDTGSAIILQNVSASCFTTQSVPISVTSVKLHSNSSLILSNITSTTTPLGTGPITLSHLACATSSVMFRNVSSASGILVTTSAFTNAALLAFDGCVSTATDAELAAVVLRKTIFSSESHQKIPSVLMVRNSQLGGRSTTWAPSQRLAKQCVVFSDGTQLQQGSVGLFSSVQLHGASFPALDMLPWPTTSSNIDDVTSSKILSTLVFEHIRSAQGSDGTVTMRVVLDNGTAIFGAEDDEVTTLSIIGRDGSYLGSPNHQLSARASITGDVRVIHPSNNLLQHAKSFIDAAWTQHERHEFTVTDDTVVSSVTTTTFDRQLQSMSSCTTPQIQAPHVSEPFVTRTRTHQMWPYTTTISNTIQPSLDSHQPLSTFTTPVRTASLLSSKSMQSARTDGHTVSLTVSHETPQPTWQQNTPIPTNVTEAPPQPPETPPPTSPEPPTATNELRVKLTTILGGGETEARVVTSTAGATSMVGASLGSGTGGVVAAISAVKLASCGLAADGTRPEYFELPIQFPIGSSHFRWYVGAVVAHASMNAAVFVVLVWLRRVSGQEPRRRKRHQLKRVVRVLSMVFTGLHTFFTPNIVGGCATVMVHDSTATGRVVGAAALLLTTVVCGAVAAAIQGALRNGVATADEGGGGAGGSKKGFSVVKRKFVASGHSTITSSSSRTTTTGSSSDSEDELGSNDSFGSNTSSSSSESDQDRRQEKSSSCGSNESRESQRLEREAARRKWLFSGPATIGTLLPLFEGCREFDRVLQRNYTTVEVGIASMIAAIAGARPNERCEYAAYATCAIAFAGIVYAVGVRPYRTYLDTAFSVANYLALVVLCVAVAVLSSSSSSTNEDGSSSNKRERSEQAMAWSLWVISSGAYLHLVIQVVWGMYVQQRRQGRLEKAEEDAAAEHTKPLLHDPRDGEVELQEVAVPKTAANKTYSFTLPDDASLSDSFASVPDTMPKFENGDAVSGEEDEAVLNDSITVNPLSNQQVI